MDVLLLDQDAVARLIDPWELLDELADGFRSLSAGTIVAPTRVEVAVEKGFSLSMPAYRAGGHIGVKVVNVFEGNESLGLPSHMALIGLFDGETGACVAVMDGTEITALRTSAAAALSARILAREHTRVLTIVGAGVQGRTHLKLLPLVRDIDEIRISSLRLADAERLAEQDQRAVAVPSAGLEAAVRESDIVCLCTHSGEPVIQANWIRAGAHVTSVGYREPHGEFPRGPARARAAVRRDTAGVRGHADRVLRAARSESGHGDRARRGADRRPAGAHVRGGGHPLQGDGPCRRRPRRGRACASGSAQRGRRPKGAALDRWPPPRNATLRPRRTERPEALRLAEAASAAQNPPMDATLKVLAASDHPASRGAAALIEAGYEESTPLEALTPGSVTRTLAETFARELAKLYEQLGEVYDSAFLDTATGASVELLVDTLCRPRRPSRGRPFKSLS